MPNEHRPDSLAEMAPLFQAVHHGCQAGRRQEALDEVYNDRIVRQGEFYLTKKLGAFGADLGLVASFFDPPFEHPAADLTEPDRAWLLNQAAFRLRALGRLGEAVAPMRAGLEMAVEQEDWKQAAISASNLSELQLTLGEVAAAVASGEAAINHADRSGDAFWRMGNRTTLADARHQAGEVAAAQALFEEAEGMQAEDQPGYARLYSLQGYRYCDLLLTLGQAEAVRERASQTLDGSRRTTGSSTSPSTTCPWDERRWRWGTGTRPAAGSTRRSTACARRARWTTFPAASWRARPSSARWARSPSREKTWRRRCAWPSAAGCVSFNATPISATPAWRLPKVSPDAAAHLESAKALVSACGYHRRDGEVEALEQALA